MNMTKAKPNRNKATPIENRVVALDTLTPHARNYNRHGDAQLADLRDGVTLDLFVGSGTTLVACEQTGRIGRGMEIEPKYCAVTLERLALLGLKPERLSANSEKSTQDGRQARQKSRVARKPETV